MIQRLRTLILNLLRIVKHFAASTFIHRKTPTAAYPDTPMLIQPFDESINTPELPAMKLFPAGRALQNDSYSFPACYGMVMPSVLYEPLQGLVLDSKRRPIEDSNQVPMRKHWYRWKPFFSRDIEEISGYSFAFRSFRSHYYHLLTDHLPALHMLGKMGWDFGEPIKLLMPRPMTDTEQFYLSRVCPAGVEIYDIELDRLYRLENYLYVSYLSQRSCGSLPRGYLEYFRDRFKPSRPRNRCKRIFISRANSTRRRITNEDDLFDVLMRFGFERYFLEEMSAEEQADLFYDAQMVVAPHGAGLANLLFSEQAKVLELFPGPLLRPHFYYICKSLKHEYRYLCARDDYHFPRSVLHDFEETFNGSVADFTVDCKAVSRLVEQMTRKTE